MARRFFFFIIFFALIGYLIFTSAALGLLGRGSVSFYAILTNQFLALGLSFLALVVMAKINYRHLQRWAPAIFLILLIMTFLVFVPGLGFRAGGASRWLDLGIYTLQPSEFLKLGFVVYLAALISKLGPQIRPTVNASLAFLITFGLVAIALILQPDLGTLGVIFLSGFAILIAARVPFGQLAVILLLVILALTTVVTVRDYALERVVTFLNPGTDPQGAGYQINQSLIAIGSGGLWGRGFGQSLQKFEFLPEPVGDSVFAVLNEEFGLLGGTVVIVLFLVFGVWGLRIAARAPDNFSRLAVVGLVVAIVAGAFANIGSMMALLPLTGIPLVFISHGGSALLAALTGCGIILNIIKNSSRSTKI